MNTPLAYLPSSPPTLDGITRAAGILDRTLPDGEVLLGSLFTDFKVRLATLLSVRSLACFDQAISDVSKELDAILQLGTVSQVVIYGTNRKTVAAKLLSSSVIPEHLSVLLAEHEMPRDELIAKTIANRLPRDTIRRLPFTLSPDEDGFVNLPGDLLESLYVQGRLVGPYQIDTDRYPFTSHCI